MPTFTKDCLYPGKYRLADGRTFEAKKTDPPALATRLNEMRAAGLHIPLCWGHQDDSKPLTEAERKANAAKFNLGFAVDANANQGFLETILDVPLDEDAKRLPSSRFVSPRIENDFIDSTGKKWPGQSIIHFAVTPRPVQHNQQPFKPVSLGIDLSLDGFSLAEEEEPPTEKKEGEAKLPEKKEEEKIPDMGSLEGLLGKLGDVAGLALPADTCAANLVERLMTSLLTLEKALENEVDDEEEEPYPGTTPPQEAAPPVQMSADGKPRKWKRKQVIKHLLSKPKRKAPKTSAVEMSMDSPAAKKLAELQAGKIKDRINALRGKIATPVVEDLLKQFEAKPVQLSLDGDPLPGEVSMLLEFVEKHSDNPFALGSSLGLDDAEPVERPADHFAPKGPPQTAEEAAPIVDAFMGMIGYAPKK